FSLSENGRILATTTGSTTDITLWDIASGRPYNTLSDPDIATALVFSPAGTILATAEGMTLGIKLWDTRTGHLLGILTGHGEPTASLSFSHDGTLLAAGDGEGAITVWNIASRTPVAAMSDGSGAI